jgi:hypothetical protein
VAISLMFGHKVGKTLEGLEFDPGKIGQCWFPGIFWVSWTSWFKAYVQHEIKKKNSAWSKTHPSWNWCAILATLRHFWCQVCLSKYMIHI